MLIRINKKPYILMAGLHTDEINEVDTDGFRNIDFSEVLMAKKTKNANLCHPLSHCDREDCAFCSFQVIDAEMPRLPIVLPLSHVFCDRDTNDGYQKNV